ncbi:MAG TPA: hypothetical protein VLX12_10145 [Syntrophorhabdales bacterium]|nr:hypothetical protein [Syntrophorhabdales bacterium]
MRWISTEVRVFAYVSNLVLLACFWGIGLGCYFSRSESRPLLTVLALVLIALAVRCEPVRNITQLLSSYSDSDFIWGANAHPWQLLPIIQGVGLTLLLFLLIMGTFIPLGQMVGRLLDGHRSVLFAYSLNIGASIIGIWAFNFFSVFYTPPWMWFLFSLLVFLVLVRWSLISIAMILVAGGLIFFLTNISDPELFVLWSPYQKLEVGKQGHGGNGYVIQVNNVFYMTMLDLSDDFLRKHAPGADLNLKRYNQYELPYAFAPRLDEILIVGAGAGNDVAGALRSGAKHVDAVEIDPGIYTLGFELHPEKPYSQRNVHVIIDDARAFFKTTTKKYDLIVFGLLDSHTLSSNYNNMRLDHYVYTEESFKEAAHLLREDGVMSVSFEVLKPAIGNRIRGLLQEAFGSVPYVFKVRNPDSVPGSGGVMFVTGRNIARMRQVVESNPGLKAYTAQGMVPFNAGVRLTSDNWPYLYLEDRTIPKMHLLILLPLLVLLLVARWSLPGLKGGRINLHFFFLGCAFLLLEFQNVSKATLLFGATWVVNSYVISSILLLILLANLFVRWVKVRSIAPYYALLLVTIMGLYFIPLDILNSLGHEVKSVVASLLLNLPIFFSGVIFIDSFRKAEAKDLAFGSNLLGSVVGGLLEPLSFVVGIKAILLLVLLLYLLSLCALLRPGLRFRTRPKTG